MFQYEWFDEKNYIPLPPKQNISFGNLLCQYPLTGIRLSHWEEHCLECAPPFCYRSCSNYQERSDRSCKNLFWGMKEKMGMENTLFLADIKFRKWGKIETHIFPAVISLKKTIWINNINKSITRTVTSLQNCLKFISPYKRLNGALTIFRKIFFRIYLAATNKPTNIFLCQFYSFEEYDFFLCIDMLQKDKLIYRNKIQAKPGENIHKLEISGLGSYLRIYPEDNREVRLLFNFCDLVRLENTGSENRPAEKLKCIVWDLDNTLWDGILIESDENSISLKPKILETIISLDKIGIIQSISSKNDEEPVLRVLERLGISEYFLYPMINWNIKSENIKRIAELLNIDVNSFGFIDDSIHEREEVALAIPQIRIYDDSVVERLMSLPELDFEITNESLQRRKMYQTEAKRKKLQENFWGINGSNIAFLKSCEIEIDIFIPVEQEDIKRSCELLSRTNQLNLSAQKYSYDIFKTIVDNDKNKSFAVSCKDKYGTFGQIAFLLYNEETENIIIREFAMSCRVAGKYIESAIIKWLQEKYNYQKKILLEGMRTKKNVLLVNNFKDIGFEDMSIGGNICLCIPAGQKPENYDIVKNVFNKSPGDL